METGSKRRRLMLSYVSSTSLDTLPDDILLSLHDHVGKHCFFGFGTVNRKLYKFFHSTHNFPKKTSPGGYKSFDELSTSHDNIRDDKYTRLSQFHRVLVGIVDFGRKDLMEWAMRKQHKRLFEAICWRAAKVGRIDFLEKFLKTVDTEILSFLTSSEAKSICEEAAREGLIETIEFLHEHNFFWGSGTCTAAASNGQFEALKYLHQKGCKWNHRTTEKAAQGGHLNILKYLHEHRCPWKHGAGASAVRFNHVDCLKYLHENGCRFPVEICTNAARYGSLDALKYLVENGFECDVRTCEEAAYHGDVTMLKYLHDHADVYWDGFDAYLGPNSERTLQAQFYHNM
eukprot:CAMPEP_0178963844 /NCGR_PEP_ID=MMETSP0789-20121207/15287_1 /TAXON_ID=3005 /ORGANISM="Rhizosolenia setigera, Strain CCMP 1694" /LENGTH=342 /DNA_ID=CAMNT_0020648433 /DNA_START=57 /DNA_END=1085 /DNA_ORIENTATION=+